MPLDLEEAILPVKRPLLDLFISTVTLLAHALAVLLQLLPSDFFLLHAVDPALLQAFQVDLCGSGVHLLLNLIDLLLDFAQPVVEGGFHLGWVDPAILDNLRRLDDIGPLAGSAAHLFNSLYFLVKQEESFVDFGIGVEVRLFNMLRQVGDDAGLDLAHLAIHLTGKVVQIIAHLAQTVVLLCCCCRLIDQVAVKCAKAVGLEQLANLLLLAHRVWALTVRVLVGRSLLGLVSRMLT